MDVTIYEFKNFNAYIHHIIEQFDFNDFAPEINTTKLKETFERIFFKEESFWKKYKKDSSDSIFLELKTHKKDTRQKIIIEFKIEEDKLNYRAYKDSANIDYESILFEDIWIDHKKLYTVLIQLFEKARKI